MILCSVGIFVCIGIWSQLRIYIVPIDTVKRFVDLNLYRGIPYHVKCFFDEVISKSGSGDKGIPN